MPSASELFDTVATELLAEHPEDERGRMLHSLGLKTGGKFYAFASREYLTVKLPEGRVQELIAGGEGEPCNPRGTGKPMREWVQLQPKDEPACAAYVKEAREFVTA